MKRALLACLLVLGSAATGVRTALAEQAAPAERATPATPATPKAEASAATAASAADPGPSYLVILSRGPYWNPAKPPTEQLRFREHGENLKRLRDAGRITLGARYSDKGMIVLRADSDEAVRAEMEADPGVKAGIFSFEFYELLPFYDGCLSVPKK